MFTFGVFTLYPWTPKDLNAALWPQTPWKLGSPNHHPWLTLVQCKPVLWQCDGNLLHADNFNILVIIMLQRRVQSIAKSMSVCSHISKTTSKLHRIFCVTCGHGGVLLWWQCNNFMYSGFVDDVIMGHILIQAWSPWHSKLFTATHQMTPLNCAPGDKLCQLPCFRFAILWYPVMFCRK